MRQLLIAAALAAPVLLAGCVWVKMAPGAQNVRVVPAGQELTACQRRGEIAVSVKDSVAFYERNQLKVRDELETLARNEAVGLGADTIQPRTEPREGEQRFVAYSCGGAAPVARGVRDGTPRAGEAETFPIDER